MYGNDYWLRDILTSQGWYQNFEEPVWLLL